MPRYMVFKDKKLLITAGTGSFGNVLLNRLLDAGLSEIRIFSGTGSCLIKFRC